MLQPEELCGIVKKHYPNADVALIAKAYDFSQKAHSQQKRASGEPYFLHPLAVAEILASLKLDVHSVITGLLHDTIEDTDVTHTDIYNNFGPEITSLVDGVTKLTRIEVQSEKTQQAENFRKLLLAMSSDIRVLLVKLVDRLHNMRTLYHIVDPKKRKRIAKESLDIYCPLAERLGINQIKEELAEIAFKELHSDAHASIHSRLTSIRNENQTTDLAAQIIAHLHEKIAKHDLSSKIIGREKSIYSIWRKMQKKEIAFEQLSDIVAFRVIVHTVSDCYKVLGAFHQEFAVVPGSFKDYISTPKQNGYQSIHTVVYGPYHHKIEVQIRTRKMHEFAEHGLAAHWRYKQNENEEAHNTTGHQYSWIRSLLDILDTAKGLDEFLEHTKLEMFQDQVFCFTPKGRLISLPTGSTPVDFAYAIHSDVGDKTMGCKINGRALPLRTVLNNGDQVEILTDMKRHPSPTWEQFVVTGKARAAIRRFIKKTHKKEFISLGKKLLQKAFLKEDIPFSEEILKYIVQKFKTPTLEDLFFIVGEGKITTRSIIQSLEDKVTLAAQDVHRNSTNISPIVIKNMIPGMAINFSACCHPIPGDKIIGVITHGKGLAVHTTDCEVATFDRDPEHITDLSWEPYLNSETRFIVRLKLVIINKVGSLTQALSAFSSKQSNLINFKVTNRNESFWEMFMDFEVKDRGHLDEILVTLNTLPAITQVERV
jgi:guanosine-3',5'-bis(diphosphate) 3'-pyrophosphohydrolase